MPARGTLSAIFIILLLSLPATAQTFVPSSAYLKSHRLPDGRTLPSPWSSNLRYGLSSDYADDRQPRSLEHVLIAQASYQLTARWSLGLDTSLMAETLDGQIPKRQEETHTDTLNPTAAVQALYNNRIYEHKYSIAVHAQPLFTEVSRREGHKGLLAAGGGLQLNFFNQRYSMSHLFDAATLLNTYHYGSNLTANPDYFVIYKFKNDLRFARTWKVSYSFGAKLTRYLDGFVGYNYNSTVSLSKTWNQFSAAATYDNGGFTDDGYVHLWYLDQYRRVVRLMVSYAF